MMVNVDVRGWHDNDNGSCNGNDNEKSDRVGSTRRREPIRVRGLGCCRAPIVRSKTVVWGTFHIHCPPAQTAIVAIIIVFVIDTQYIKRFEEISVLYLLGLHARLKIGTFKMYLSLLLLHDSGCMFSSLSWEQKFWGAQLRLKMKMIAIVAQIKITTRRPQWKFEVQFCPPSYNLPLALTQTASWTLHHLQHLQKSNHSLVIIRYWIQTLPIAIKTFPIFIKCGHKHFA